VSRTLIAALGAGWFVIVGCGCSSASPDLSRQPVVSIPPTTAKITPVPVDTSAATTPRIVTNFSVPKSSAAPDERREFPFGGRPLVMLSLNGQQVLDGGIAAIVSLLPDGTAIATALDPDGGKCSAFWLVSLGQPPKHLFDRSTTLCPSAGSSDGHYLVWAEDSGNFPTTDWTIWSYNLGSAELTKVASWSDYGSSSNQSVSGPVSPQIDQGLIVWSAVAGSPPQSVIFEAHADGSTPPTIVLKDASNARYVYPSIAYADVSNASADPTLALFNLLTGEQSALGPLPSTGNIAFTGDLVAVTSSAGLDLVSVKTRAWTHVASGLGSGYPEASKSLIVWYDAEHSYVYQVLTERVTQLGTRPAANDVGLSGNFVWWLEDSDESRESESTTFEYIVAGV
jgi:hypothetical protein